MYKNFTYHCALSHQGTELNTILWHYFDLTFKTKTIVVMIIGPLITLFQWVAKTFFPTQWQREKEDWQCKTINVMIFHDNWCDNFNSQIHSQLRPTIRYQSVKLWLWTNVKDKNCTWQLTQLSQLYCTIAIPSLYLHA